MYVPIYSHPYTYVALCHAPVLQIIMYAYTMRSECTLGPVVIEGKGCVQLYLFEGFVFISIAIDVPLKKKKCINYLPMNCKSWHGYFYLFYTVKLY